MVCSYHPSITFPGLLDEPIRTLRSPRVAAVFCLDQHCGGSPCPTQMRFGIPKDKIIKMLKAENFNNLEAANNFGLGNYSGSVDFNIPVRTRPCPCDWLRYKIR
eukprot:scaffold91255_cov75-Attheya_sp.AAC.7